MFRSFVDLQRAIAARGGKSQCTGTWKLSFCPTQHERDHEGAITILQLNIHGVQAAMIMTEIYVERNDHGSRGSSVASFQAVAAMIMIYSSRAYSARTAWRKKARVPHIVCAVFSPPS